jgi:hypothetical protein
MIFELGSLLWGLELGVPLRGVGDVSAGVRLGAGGSPLLFLNVGPSGDVFGTLLWPFCISNNVECLLVGPRSFFEWGWRALPSSKINQR